MNSVCQYDHDEMPTGQVTSHPHAGHVSRLPHTVCVLIITLGVGLTYYLLLLTIINYLHVQLTFLVTLTAAQYSQNFFG